MKKIFLLALGGAFTLSSFSLVKGKHKSSKKSKVNASQSCPSSCPKGRCIKM